LVSNAWAGFGAAFGPVVLFSLLWKRMTRLSAIAGMLVGAITVLIWIYAPLSINGQSLSQWIYEIIPGFIAASMTIVIVSMLTRQDDKSIDSTFAQVEQIVKQQS
ncbi:MAG: SSS family solute:Na+ symporter, partial [Paraglaciecola sp.]